MVRNLLCRMGRIGKPKRYQQFKVFAELKTL